MLYLFSSKKFWGHTGAKIIKIHPFSSLISSLMFTSKMSDEKSRTPTDVLLMLNNPNYHVQNAQTASLGDHTEFPAVFPGVRSFSDCEHI